MDIFMPKPVIKQKRRVAGCIVKKYFLHRLSEIMATCFWTAPARSCDKWVRGRLTKHKNSKRNHFKPIKTKTARINPCIIHTDNVICVCWGNFSFIFVLSLVHHFGPVFAIVFVTAYSTAACMYSEMWNSSFKPYLILKWSVFYKAIYQPAIAWHDSYNLFNPSLPNFYAKPITTCWQTEEAFTFFLWRNP